jgi:hypothetical protein
MAMTPRTNSILDQVHDLIGKNHYRDAIDLINRSGQHSAPMENARGVCLLRMGEIEKAGKVFHGLVFPTGSICADPNCPVTYHTNFVTAMFLSGNHVAGLGVLGQIRDRRHPSVARLQAALKTWKKGLGLLQRLGCAVNAYPQKPVTVDFPPGDL